MKTPFHRITSVAPSHSMRSNWMIAFLAAVGAVGAAHSASAGGGVRAWSSSTGNNWNKYSQSNVAADLGECTAVGAGQWHTLALRTDGTMRAWGWNNDGQCNVPSDLGVCIGFDGGDYHTVALRQDGVVRQRGNTPTGLPANLGTCTAVAAGQDHLVAINQTGYVRVWGAQSDVPSDLGKCTAVAAGNYHVIVVAADGYSLLPTSNAALTAANTALTAQLNCGDLNGDGEVNGADLGRMLISWGQCQ